MVHRNQEGKKMKTKMSYITERPSFDDLANLREKGQECLSLITALAEEPDIIQGATDLHLGVLDFMESVTELVNGEDWICVKSHCWGREHHTA